jgi:ribosome-binding factor A
MLRVVDLPVGTLATVTRVACSPDFEHAKVWVSVLPSEQTAATLLALDGALGELQHLLIQKVEMDPVPKIRFLLDDSEQRASKIVDLLDTLG